MLDREYRRVAYFFILPALIGLVSFRLYPILAAFFISFTNWNVFGHADWVGLDNYVEIFASREGRLVLVNTAWFAVIYVPGIFVLGLALALALNTGFRWAVGMRALYFLPYITSTVAVTLTWRWIFSTRFGLLNNLLLELGVHHPPAWLGDPAWSLYSVIFVAVWRDSGFYMILFLAGLQTVDQQLVESARIDGASRWEVLRYVTLPLLAPTSFFVLLIAMVRSTQTFEITYALTGGGPNQSSTTLAFYIYQNAFVHFDMGYAAALAYVLCMVIGGLTLIHHRLRKKWAYV
jgi:multiple sugar transport system permease protein